MKKIEKIYLSHLLNKEHYQFMNDVDQLITTSNASNLGIGTLYQNFRTALHEEENVQQSVICCMKSKKIEELNILRTQIWSASDLRIKSSLMSPFADEAASAIIVKQVVDLHGDIRSMSLNEGNNTVSNLIHQLQLPVNQEHANKIGIDNWIEELKIVNDILFTICIAQNTAVPHHEHPDIRLHRLNTDKIYTEMTEKINALVVLGIAEASTIGFINELNTKIKYYQTTIPLRSVAPKAHEFQEKLN